MLTGVTVEVDETVVLGTVALYVEPDTVEQGIVVYPKATLPSRAKSASWKRIVMR